ncbi:mitochondrial K+-H+ exchange-related-domain-containing protein [Trichophaea hybrida]|nr:mitochondrial K+-H+ exchange-related-domain-containing protein [Trichophaea hybrida]
MRLFLVPISTRRTLIYGQRLNKVTHPTPSMADKASARAAKLWLQWESRDKGWQKKATEYGNKLFNRIPFEEWGLKSIPPLSARRQQREIEGKKIEVIYPPSIISEKSVSKALKKLATERNVLHRKRLMWSIVGMPIMAPFGLIPLIPNLPFFYLIYRAFSHWKALSGAKHLKFLVEKNLFQPVQSSALDAVYIRHASATTIDSDALVKETKVEWTEVNNRIIKREEKDAKGGERDVLLIEMQDAQAIAKVAGFPALAVECERAYKQVAGQMKLHAEEEAQRLRAEKADQTEHDTKKRT